MNCPKCSTELVQKFYKGMLEVDSCPNCRGMWLDVNELDKLEDVIFDDDARKGSLIHFQRKTEFRCPHCESLMMEFQYRLYNLNLDYCSEHAHGFWLDAGEEERVMEFMGRRAGDVERKVNAEMEWKQVLKNMHSFLKNKKRK
jgi:Zn-finger nucleic acid-binding protein